MNLNHLYLLVRDVDQSAAFYRELFGFDGQEERQGEALVIRNRDGFSLGLAADPMPPQWPHGLHFGFLLESVGEARRLRDRVVAHGVALVEAYEEPGFVVFKCLDPDGYILEVEAGVPVNPPA